MSSKLRWYTFLEAGPWQYDGPIETYKKGWPYSKIYQSWDRIDKRFNQIGMIWRPARSEDPTMASDMSIGEGLWRAGIQETPELFDAVPDNPIEI